MMMTIISIWSWMNCDDGGSGDDDFDLMIKSMLRHFDVSYYQQQHDDGLKGSFFIVMITARLII